MTPEFFLTLLAAIVIAGAIIWALVLYQEHSRGICTSVKVAAAHGKEVGDTMQMLDDRGRMTEMEIVAIGDANTLLVKPLKRRKGVAVTP